MTKTGRARQIFKPEFQFGLGGVPLGNEFKVVTEEGARLVIKEMPSVSEKQTSVSEKASGPRARPKNTRCTTPGQTTQARRTPADLCASG